MTESQSKVQRVQQLKERLSHTQDPRKISKTLKSLQELDISLDILVETGIGKTVNGFRKHSDVGDVAKSIVLKWKKLVPEEKELDPKYEKKAILEDKKLTHSEKTKNTEKLCESTNESKKRTDSKTDGNVKKNKDLPKEVRSEKNISNEEHNVSKYKKHPKSPDHNLNISKVHEKKKTSEKTSSSHVEKKKTPQKDESKQPDKTYVKPKPNAHINSQKVQEDFEEPTMSFESYLNYDQVSNKRKKRPSSSSEPPKKIQVCKQYCNLELSKAENVQAAVQKNSSTDIQEEKPGGHIKEVKTGSLADLLNVPLPKFLPEYDMLPSPPQSSEHKANISQEITEADCESSGFTGRRLNSKMLVYSGSKTIYLPKMLTLYEQCIRVLQNNVDAIQEVGGVPFNILEPVLERCTPEQLSRIEECNPAFIEDSDHLWKKHCDKDFKHHRLLEYESWREMYLRVFSEREEKLRMITHSISSAHSGKPKGRQVKLAYIHGAAKPPRHIRRRQEIHGTAGPIAQPHPIDKYKLQKPENRDKCVAVQNPHVTTNTASIITNNPCGGPSQDPKRTVKRVAPMMAKSMRAFRNRVGPR
ncbi:elongin-A-like [Discoglossus pictus]